MVDPSAVLAAIDMAIAIVNQIQIMRINSQRCRCLRDAALGLRPMLTSLKAKHSERPLHNDAGVILGRPAR